MSSAQRSERIVAQDYIVRIRYENQLPPPPNPPKLLDVPGTGLAGGQYTSAGYASRLAREQQLNIEADAEMGVPIDLIGMPGVFDGDERSIMARPGPQTLDPADRALLRPLSVLNKGAAASSGVSFLRRTEYISSQGPQHFSSSTSKDLLRLKHDPKRKHQTGGKKDDPFNILRHVVKGFDVAYPRDAGEDTQSTMRGAAVTDADIRAWSNPKHPTRPGLQLLDNYPVLPDLDAVPNTGCFLIVKFIANPLSDKSRYDDRLDAAILRPVPNKEAEARYEQRRADWERDHKDTKPGPSMEYDYDYFLPEKPAAPRGIKRKLDPSDPGNDDRELYTDEAGDGGRAFKFLRLRTYETYQQIADPGNYYNDTLALALHDPEVDAGPVPGVKKRLQKAAYFYPIVQRTSLRPKRRVGQMSHTQTPQDADMVDEIYATVTEPSEQERQDRRAQLAQLDPSLGVEMSAASD